MISKSHETFILDNKDTEEAIKKKKEKYLKLMDKLESANTLLEAFDDKDDAEGIQTDNMTVVAFYLISKESGNLFAKLLDVITRSEMHAETKVIPSHPGLLPSRRSHRVLQVLHRRPSQH